MTITVAMTQNIRITVLVENSTSQPGLLAEHGLAFWIECGQRRILFDTGQSDILVRNAKALGVNLAETDAIVLSHGHYDHTGGLSAVLDIATEATVYLHPAAIEPKFGRKGPKCRSIGMPEHAKEAIQTREVIQTEGPTQIFQGVTVTGQIPHINNFEDVGGPFFLDESCQKPDGLCDDQALFFESPKGLVIVFGCTHAGVVNTLHRIADLSGRQHFHAVMGGMHLINASRERIERTIDAFRRYDVQKIGPAHCTGVNAIARFWSVFPNRSFVCSVGVQISVGKQTSHLGLN
jgi:7,8-dihydropterin-6-yl-methyl-4-(beta-D-ribofuranosyl)aminobenzene 5'-phosphate synthase